MAHVNRRSTSFFQKQHIRASRHSYHLCDRQAAYSVHMWLPSAATSPNSLRIYFHLSFLDLLCNIISLLQVTHISPSPGYVSSEVSQMTFMSDKYKCAPTSVGCISSFEFGSFLVTVLTAFDVFQSIEDLNKLQIFCRYLSSCLVMPTCDVLVIDLNMNVCSFISACAGRSHAFIQYYSVIALFIVKVKQINLKPCNGF